MPPEASTPVPTAASNGAGREGGYCLATTEIPSDSTQRLDEVLSTLSAARSEKATKKNVLTRVGRSLKTLVQPLPLDSALQDSHRALRAYKIAGGIRQLDDSIRSLQKAVDLISTEGESLMVRPNLAHCLYLRYKHTNQIEDLDAAIAAQRRAVDLVATHLPNNTVILFQLSQFLRCRFRRLERLKDLEDAIHALQRAITIDDQARFHVDLGFCLRYRFEALGIADELKDAITHLQHALSLLQDDNSLKLHCLKELSLCLRSSFGNLGNLVTLHHAIATSTRAVELAGNLKLGDVNCLLDLSSLLYLRFENTGHIDSLDDLHRSIESRQQAIEFMDNSRSSMLSQSLTQLCLYLRRRFEFVGDIDDLHGAIAARERAIELMPDAQIENVDFRLSLASLIFLRFEALGNLEDLDRSVQLCREETELVRHTRAPRRERVTHLSLQLLRRYERSQALADLENVIATSRDALQLALLHDVRFDKGAFHNLLDLRSQCIDSLSDRDLDTIIAQCKRNMKHEWSYLEPAEQLANLALYHYYRFLRQGDLEDLESSISAAQDAIAAEPNTSVAHSERLIALGTYLLHRFEHVDDIIDLDSAILSTQLALESLYEDHPARRRGLSNLGFCFQYRFDRLKEMDDIESAVVARRRLIALTPKTHADRPGVLEQLCFSLESRFMRDRTSGNYETARRCLETAISQTLGEPFSRLKAAARYAQLVANTPEFNTVDSLLLSYSRIIDVLPELAWLGDSTHRTDEQTTPFDDLVGRAVSAAISVGALSQAVEWFEVGRALIWSNASPSHTRLKGICDQHSDLARPLSYIRSELQSLGFIAGQRHGKLVAEYERLMSVVRDCAECKDFLRPTKLADFLSSSAFGLLSSTLIFINVTQDRCDALLLSSTGDIQLVQLPALTQKRAHTLHRVWIQQVEVCGLRTSVYAEVGSAHLRPSRVIFSQVLKRLWMWVIHPILQALDLSQTSASSGLPHIAWCPTGPLTQLPLHAAGVYDGDLPRARVEDHVVSSYIPSLSALLRCCGTVSTEHLAPNVLVVTPPYMTLGRAQLPGSRNESAILRDLLPDHQMTVLNHDRSTVAATLAAIGHDSHAWIRLACRAGSQSDLDGPTQSAFKLYDGPLTLNTLMDTVTNNIELIFLSGYPAAAGDRKIPAESAHLAADMLAVGFKGVVATMWSIRDEDAPIVVEAYYKALVDIRNFEGVQRGQTGAAFALHEATRRLREEAGEKSLERWVPFVHYGV